jgi:Flp pilus assembly protein TadG
MTLKRFRACQSGAAAIEFSIVSLLMIVVSIGVVEIGRGLNVRSKMAYAADLGARTVLINASIPDTQIEGTVRAAFTGADASLLQVQIGQETVNGASYRTLAVSYPFSPIIPNMTTSQINMTVNRRVPAQ